MAAEYSAASLTGPSHLTPLKPTLHSNYWPVFPSSFQIFTSTPDHVRASAFPSHSHSLVKVVKPDWAIRSTSALTSTDSEPGLKGTCLGHAVRPPVGRLPFHSYLTHMHPEFHRQVPACCNRLTRRTRSRLVRPHLLRVRWPVSSGGYLTPPSYSVHSSGTTRLTFVVYSHNYAFFHETPFCSPWKSQMYSCDHLDIPTLQQIRDLGGENLHLLVSLGNKMWFGVTEIPTLQVTELDWWDDVTLPTRASLFRTRN